MKWRRREGCGWRFDVQKTAAHSHERDEMRKKRRDRSRTADNLTRSLSHSTKRRRRPLIESPTASLAASEQEIEKSDCPPEDEKDHSLDRSVALKKQNPLTMLEQFTHKTDLGSISLRWSVFSHMSLEDIWLRRAFQFFIR
jgi:hypothetical protein